jgi:hypothetical protein
MLNFFPVPVYRGVNFMVDQAIPAPLSQGSSTATHTPNQKERSSSAAKNAASASDGKVSRQQKLKFHLLIGFLMATFAIAGYMLIGPHSHVNAAGSAATHIINVAPTAVNTAMGLPTTYSYEPYELAAIQAEMDAITHQINAVKSGMTTGSASSYSSPNQNPGSPLVNNPNSTQAQTNTMNAQTNPSNSTTSNAGHGHH